MRKLRIVVSGAGNRVLPKNRASSNWLGWLGQIRCSEKFSLVAAHDPASESRGRIIAESFLPENRVYADCRAMLDENEAEAMLIASPAEYHAEYIELALQNNLHVMVEKPFVTELASGGELCKLARQKNLKIAVVQNWRAKSVAQAARKAIHARHLIGRVGQVFFRYIRNRENSKLPPYILKEPYPLLYAMGVHHIDLIRYLLDDEIISVQGVAFKPHWSLYDSKTSMNLFMRTRNGASVIYAGTFSSLNSVMKQESLLIEGDGGSLANDSDWSEPPLLLFAKGSRQAIDLTAEVSDRTMRGQYDLADQFIMENFYKAIVDDEELLCSGEEALKTLAVLEASKEACETGRVIQISNEPENGRMKPTKSEPAREEAVVEL